MLHRCVRILAITKTNAFSFAWLCSSSWFALTRNALDLPLVLCSTWREDSCCRMATAFACFMSTDATKPKQAPWILAPVNSKWIDSHLKVEQTRMNLNFFTTLLGWGFKSFAVTWNRTAREPLEWTPQRTLNVRSGQTRRPVIYLRHEQIRF